MPFIAPDNRLKFTYILTYSVRLSDVTSANCLDEPRHDFLPDYPHIMQLALEAAAAGADPQLSCSGLRDFFYPRYPVTRIAGEGEAPERIVSQSKPFHALRMPTGLKDMIIKYVSVDVSLNLFAQIIGYAFVLETIAHRMIEDGGDRRLDVVDRPVAVLMKRSSRGEPNIDCGGIRGGGAGVGGDARAGD